MISPVVLRRKATKPNGGGGDPLDSGTPLTSKGAIDRPPQVEPAEEPPLEERTADDVSVLPTDGATGSRPRGRMTVAGKARSR